MEVTLLFGTGAMTLIFAAAYVKNRFLKPAKPLLIYSFLSLMLFVVLCVYNLNLYKEDISQAVSSFGQAEPEKAIQEERPKESTDPEQKQANVSTEANVTEKILDAPLINQMPELPRGCEVTSLAMLLQDAGVNADKMTLAKEIKRDLTPMTKQNGKTYFGNPHTGFVGDMYSFETPGYGVYNEPIFELAERYLPGKVENITGESFDSIINKLKDNKTVWIITNATFDVLGEEEFRTWETPDGPVEITYREHSVLVTGFDENYIYFNDPLTGIKNNKSNKAAFIAAWEQMGKQAISLK
ncbi:C39 family peptidase [Domibacillus sp. DTU_2020_1001157_1_SI_ALB_TIR_016]|uniref:C39 family peptidase n=1 Tax=Domibacillus sp. DTU_2020_1001157_1_SI_ALB_TIR_016 TaxID=3077789 RepID=UPI0028E9925C|nr:C39 family peptidase [Domibacillus sp. DTU_2020_1001157_1_SI_ALB_TIR_016]WNS78293.1 C39 family peptidase [Domibacillus sp. DTU_2020_1001157_1_SI_ALB_TIR_016]